MDKTRHRHGPGGTGKFQEAVGGRREVAPEPVRTKEI
jgi:hypothetical protein